MMVGATIFLQRYCAATQEDHALPNQMHDKNTCLQYFKMHTKYLYIQPSTPKCFKNQIPTFCDFFFPPQCLKISIQGQHKTSEQQTNIRCTNSCCAIFHKTQLTQNCIIQALCLSGIAFQIHLKLFGLFKLQYRAV